MVFCSSPITGLSLCERSKRGAAHPSYLEFVQTNELVPAGADFQGDGSEADILEEHGVLSQVVLQTFLAVLLRLR